MIIFTIGLKRIYATQRNNIDYQKILDAMQKHSDVLSTKYNMSIAVAFQNSDRSFGVASGFTNVGLHEHKGSSIRKAQHDDIYVW